MSLHCLHNSWISSTNEFVFVDKSVSSAGGLFKWASKLSMKSFLTVWWTKKKGLFCSVMSCHVNWWWLLQAFNKFCWLLLKTFFVRSFLHTDDKINKCWKILFLPGRCGFLSVTLALIGGTKMGHISNKVQLNFHRSSVWRFRLSASHTLVLERLRHRHRRR